MNTMEIHLVSACPFTTEYIGSSRTYISSFIEVKGRCCGIFSLQLNVCAEGGVNASISKITKNVLFP